MRGLRSKAVVAVLLLLGIDAVWAPAGRVQEVAPVFVRLSEWSLWNAVTTAPLPAYPATSLSRKTSGVAVARVIVGTDGRTETVTLLEAPDEAIGSAVGDAIKQWTFASIRGPAPESKPARASATLTLYFRIQNGKGLVFAARDMPGAVVPPRVPAPAPGAPPPAPPSVFRAETSARVVNQAELAMMVSSGSTIVVDVRDRDAFRRTHRDGALNIPRQELDVRGPIELRGAKNVVIDCTHETEGLCRLAARYLERVANVAIFIP